MSTWETSHMHTHTLTKQGPCGWNVFCWWVFKNGLVMHYIYNRTCLLSLCRSLVYVCLAAFFLIFSLLSLFCSSPLPPHPPPLPQKRKLIFSNQFFSLNVACVCVCVLRWCSRSLYLCLHASTPLCCVINLVHLNPLAAFFFYFTLCVQLSVWVCLCVSYDEWLCIYHKAVAILTPRPTPQLWQLLWWIEFTLPF